MHCNLAWQEPLMLSGVLMQPFSKAGLCYKGLTKKEDIFSLTFLPWGSKGVKNPYHHLLLSTHKLEFSLQFVPLASILIISLTISFTCLSLFILKIDNKSTRFLSINTFIKNDNFVTPPLLCRHLSSSVCYKRINTHTHRVCK